MNRRLLKLAMFLALGAVVNIAVAWGCALWLNMRWTDYAELALPPSDPGGLSGYGLFRIGAARLNTMWPPPLPTDPSREEIARWIREHGITGTPSFMPVPQVKPPYWCRLFKPRAADEPLLHGEDARGWPRLSMHCDLTLSTGSYDIYVTAVRNGIALGGVHLNGLPVPGSKPVFGIPPAYTRAIVLPLRPLWPGFLLNTLFYAAALWLLFSAPLTLRRWRRGRRGLCVKCAYDLRGIDSPQCPECGAPIAPRSPAHQ